MRLLEFADTQDDGAPGAMVHRYAWAAPGSRSASLETGTLVRSDSSFPVQRRFFLTPMNPGWQHCSSLSHGSAMLVPRALPAVGVHGHSLTVPCVQICSWTYSGARRPTVQSPCEPLPAYRPDARPRVLPSGPPAPWLSAQSREASRQHLEASRRDF